LPARCHKEIRRLNVTVRDAFRVRRADSIRDLNGEIKQGVNV
jgi:hypothetical protein